MEIDEKLKKNIRADIVNVLPITLKTEDIDSLIRCLEITIGHHYSVQLPQPEINADLALKISRFVHNECKDVPHDIGLQIMEIINPGSLPPLMNRTNRKY